ncbi:MAG: hypothetical protein B6I25_02625 [Planctomycetales bacterium 4572_13]|nr:MAG: hypothetical protein B6I25_02625 [Planctomycetales bacterium 4572_13]
MTGAILYITPPGRVANWTNWTIWGLSKHQWGAVHICFGVVFLIASVLHIWLNFRPLMSYFVRKTKDASKLRTEWILALAVCGLVFWGVLKPFAPFSSLLDLNDHIKNSWEKPQQQPPIPHAETLTIAELAKKSDIELDTIIQNLKAAGIETNPSDIFGTIAEQQNLSPNELFEIATGRQTKPAASGRSKGGGGGGSSYGQKTLKQACGETGIEPEKAVEALKAAGFEATADMRIREIADQNTMRPGQIRQILENL